MCRRMARSSTQPRVRICPWFSMVIHRIVTDNGVELLTGIAGLLLSAIAVELAATAVLAFSRQR